MYTKQELDLVGTYEADTVRDEDLLNMAKYIKIYVQRRVIESFSEVRPRK